MEKNSSDSSLKIKHIMSEIGQFFVRTLSIKDGTDIEGTIEGIKKDIAFKGHSAWILMFSIFIASIGLNVNSTAVIVGAMLISPLMGPILGIGLSVGTNDWEILLRSLKNLGIAVCIALLTSTLYFLITPLSEAQSELLSRTKPTFLDVLIAVFGGFAGIVAGSRSEKSNVIPGVAIATALMPPLCTAGYGLANMNMKFFLGAFYLFFLNSVFISISTFIIVRYLHFPIKNFMHNKKSNRLRRYIIFFVIIVITPSAIIFMNIIKESRFLITTNEFIEENIKFEGSELINKSVIFNDTLSVINLYMIGEEIDEETIKRLNKKVEDYGLVKKGSFWKTGSIPVTDRTIVKVHQAKNNTETIVQSKIDYARKDISNEVRTGLIKEMFEKNELTLSQKNRIIDSLTNKLNQIRTSVIPFVQISKEIKVNYSNIEKMAYAKSVETLFNEEQDTITTFLVKWNRRTYRNKREKERKEIEKWLKVRLNLDTVRVVSY